MILQPTDYSVANLLHSTDAVAIVQLADDDLKHVIIDLVNSGYGHVVVETASGQRWLIYAVNERHGGNLVGHARYLQKRYVVFIKRCSEVFETPTTNSFRLPDGRVVEFEKVLVRSSNFTHWGLGNREVLPNGYVRI